MTLQQQTTAVPPYVPYRTFQTFLEFLLDEGIPGRIDKTVWGLRFSGSSGTQLMTALKVLTLVDADGHPSNELENLVGSKVQVKKTGKSFKVNLNFQDFEKLKQFINNLS